MKCQKHTSPAVRNKSLMGSKLRREHHPEALPQELNGCIQVMHPCKEARRAQPLVAR
jgi:hypothetical protein